MNKGTNKRGFIPPQPAAAISALDFAAASQGLARARAAYEAATDANDLDTAAAAIRQTADRLVSTPATALPEIAEKVAALAVLRGHAWDIARKPEQWRIAEEGDDDAKGLLALYLDLARLSEAGA